MLKLGNCIVVFVTMKKKSVVDNHIESAKHKAAEQKHKNNSQPLQRSLLSFTNNDHDKINIAIIEAFTKANFPLEKIYKLKPFLIYIVRMVFFISKKFKKILN